MTDSETFLAHFGVKGMKWGVRKQESSSAKTRYKTPPKKLTSAQLDARIKRLEKEKRYNELNARQVSKGEKLTSDLIQLIGKNAAATVGTAALVYGGKLAIKRIWGDDVLSGMFPKKK